MPKPTPMPEIEAGDWVLEDNERHPYIVRPGHLWSLSDHKPFIREVRKSDGRIWRREEPQR